MTAKKDVHLVASPERPPDLPTPPIYESPWPAERIRGAVIVFEATLYAIVREFDLALAAAQFELWQTKGALQVKEMLDK